MDKLVLPEYRKAFQSFTRSVIQGNKGILTFEIQGLKGTRRWLETHAVPMTTPAGETVLLGITRDITERQHAERTARKLNRTLVLLSACNEALVRITGEQELVQDICQLIVELGDYPRAWVGYAEHDAAKHIRIVAQCGEQPGVLESLGLTWADDEHGQHPSALVIRNNRPLVVQDVSREPGLVPWRDMMIERGIAALIVLPLAVNKQPLGVLNIIAAQADAFDSDEIKLLSELADDLSFGIGARRMSQERDVAVREQERSLERLRESLVDTVTAITTTVEMRDPYTAGHERRVAELATAIAREMGLSNDQIDGIHFGGLIHDLGKIKIPAEILSKPGRLSKTEFELVASHSQAGYDILKGIKFPWPIAQMVLQHHERLDGSGYPEGLKGEDIIIEARILAVADTVEAMSSHRPYRPALGIDKALAEIEQQRDRLYDAKAVDACLKLFRAGNFSLSA
jgi:HD-GYP domain-containing protein (c-di-GMP phosphodiesterase class II)